MQSLGVISVNIWQIIISLLNLLILFLLLKKFLYKPVKNFVAKREMEVEKNLNDAKASKEEAKKLEEQWQEEIDNAKEKSNEIIKTATENANKRSDEIVNEAKDKASSIIENAKTQADLEMKKAESEIKDQVIVLSSELTEKLLKREVNADDNKELIDSFFEEVGKK